MNDALISGRRFRTFNIVDNFNREALAIEIDLNRIVAGWNYRLKMLMDNGSEFISLTVDQ